jgi:D-methionine transport system ATP-binding protein
MNAPVGPLLADTACSSARSSTGEPALIELDGVGKVYVPRRGGAAIAALDGVSLRVPRGAIVGVIGRSGAGKSTLIRLVNGLEKPAAGRVIVDGADITQLAEKNLRRVRRSIGMVFQHFNLLPSRTAFGNVALPLEIAGRGRSEIKARVEEFLDLVGLAGKRDAYPAELSGGQKQRVGIALALATAPKVLLSDEATSALDPETTLSILDLLARINAELGLTILLITHEMAVIRRIAHEVAVLDHGRIVERGDVLDIFSRPQHSATQSFLAGESGRAVPRFIAARLQATPPVVGGQLSGEECRVEGSRSYAGPCRAGRDALPRRLQRRRAAHRSARMGRARRCPRGHAWQTMCAARPSCRRRCSPHHDAGRSSHAACQ